MPKYLSKADILSAPDVRCEDVEVPEWGGVVRVKVMTGAEKDAFEASVTAVTQKNGKTIQRMNMANVRAKLLARCIVDEGGRPIFDDADIDALGEKSAAAMDRVVEIAKRLNRISAEDIKTLSDDLKNDQPAG